MSMKVLAGPTEDLVGHRIGTGRLPHLELTDEELKGFLNVGHGRDLDGRLTSAM